MENKELKEYICTSCGKKMMATKFASQKTIQCSECKENKLPINPDIVSDALKVNPVKVREKSTGNTKDRPCIKCGEMVTVSKFMSDIKVLCPNCKGESSRISNIPDINIDMSKLDKSQILPIEEYEVNNGIISNKKLLNIVCPACGYEHMKILRIIDWSTFGLIVSYQCPECFLTMTLSEQSQRMHKRCNMGKSFDYSGEEIKDMCTSMIDHSRLSNIVLKLIKKLEDNNIKIEDIERPPYQYIEQKPVPVGFKIPSEDMWIKVIDDAIHMLDDINKNGLSSLVSTDIGDMVYKLKLLLKGEENESNIKNE